jgi:hypothetical protein
MVLHPLDASLILRTFGFVIVCAAKYASNAQCIYLPCPTVFEFSYPSPPRRTCPATAGAWPAGGGLER